MSITLNLILLLVVALHQGLYWAWQVRQQQAIALTPAFSWLGSIAVVALFIWLFDQHFAQRYRRDAAHFYPDDARFMALPTDTPENV